MLKFVEGHKLECLVTLVLTTGMRKGEQLALHWSDFGTKNALQAGCEETYSQDSSLYTFVQ
ncbi:hypothetical protein KSD_89130 [Ktedonobacter sp. SOSP1-85]|nr:hypothetical protein KSD_89130 [Ktedonobacter sp. SOSP1-85]